MKRFLFIICSLLFAVNTFADNSTISGYTTDCLIWNNGYWVSIGNDGYGIDITINYNTIVINSNKFQIFHLYNVSNWYRNKDGHNQFTADAYDEDHSKCRIRVVERNDIEAPIQIYFHYNNISYVYNVMLY